MRYLSSEFLFQHRRCSRQHPCNSQRCATAAASRPPALDAQLREGDEARVAFRFVHAAEFVRGGSPCVLRDASAGADQLGLAVGVVLSTVVSPSRRESRLERDNDELSTLL